jgi:S1-C subfamily serine protease
LFAPLFLLAALQVITFTEVGSSELGSTVTVSGRCQDLCPSGSVSIGAGEIIGRRSDGKLLVLTARHVIERATSLVVFVRNGASPGIEFASFSRIAAGRRATVVAYAANVDLALVAFTPLHADQYNFAPIAASWITNESQPGVIVGDPNGSLWTVSSYSFLRGNANTFELSCDTCGPGDSGGGVFDASGKLLGIVVQQAIDGDSAGRTSQFRAVALPEMKMFLRVTGTDNVISERAHDTDAWKRFDTMRSRFRRT